MTQMTVELLKATLPRALQGNATQELADKINQIALDPEVAEEVRSNFLSYTKVLQEGKFKTEAYLDAVIYVTHKLMGYSNQDAYIRTFPARYQTLVAKGVSSKDLSAYVAAYHGNKLVNLIMEQALVPVWLLNRDAYQRAINTQLELMGDLNVSPKVRSDAANSILTHLKQPETKKIELDVGLKENGGIADLQATMLELARKQKQMIEQGLSAREVAAARLVGKANENEGVDEVVDAEFTPVTPVAVPTPPTPPTPAKTDGGFAQQAATPVVTAAEIFERPTPGSLGNPGTPGLPASLFAAPPSSPSLRPSGASEEKASKTAASPAPGATAAQPPASAEGEGAAAGGRDFDAASLREAREQPRRPAVSLFDPATFPLGS